MSEIGKLAMEQAERRVDAERDSSVARVQAKLRPAPHAVFCSCGAQIPEARRIALPSATSCVECAAAREAVRR